MTDLTETPPSYAKETRDRGRVGRFSMPGEYLLSTVPDARLIMAQCTIVRAEHIYFTDKMEYVAFCDAFRCIEPNEIIPEYEWVFSDMCTKVTPYEISSGQLPNSTSA